MPLPQYIANIANLVKSGYRSNAFAPYVWFIAVVAAVELAIMFTISDVFIRRVLTLTFVATVLFGMYMYFALFKKDARLLQSESFRLEDKKLDLIAQKGSDIHIEPVTLTTPTNRINQGGESE